MVMKPMVRKGKKGSREKRVFEPDMYKYGELFGKKEDENFLINNATFGSGNMNLNDTYGEAEVSNLPIFQPPAPCVRFCRYRCLLDALFGFFGLPPFHFVVIVLPPCNFQLILARLAP